MGSSDSIDFSLSNLYKSWYAFRRGKAFSSETSTFQYYLEANLYNLHTSLTSHNYCHGGYSQYIIQDSKRREIAVAPVRDRVVHRLIYDHLLPIWDRTFIYDVWSCRPNKGQHQAIQRAESLMKRYSKGWIWRADIQKFFDNVSQDKLFSLIQRRVSCPDTLWLIEEVLSSYYKGWPGKGMPIGNLTSQIFANIYLNELDRYVTHIAKPCAYLRYGDDWLCFSTDEKAILELRAKCIDFLSDTLELRLSRKLDIVKPVDKGVTYLGVDLWPDGKRLTRSTRSRLKRKLQIHNFASYESLIRTHSPQRTVKDFYWQTFEDM